VCAGQIRGFQSAAYTWASDENTFDSVTLLCASARQVVEALQQAGVRCRINVVLDGPVAVDVALVQPKVKGGGAGLTGFNTAVRSHLDCPLAVL
jgi:hypothetical protein